MTKEHKPTCRCMSCTNNRVAQLSFRVQRLETWGDWLTNELIKRGVVVLPKQEDETDAEQE